MSLRHLRSMQTICAASCRQPTRIEEARSSPSRPSARTARLAFCLYPLRAQLAKPRPAHLHAPESPGPTGAPAFVPPHRAHRHVSQPAIRPAPPSCRPPHRHRCAAVKLAPRRLRPASGSPRWPAIGRHRLRAATHRRSFRFCIASRLRAGRRHATPAPALPGLPHSCRRVTPTATPTGTSPRRPSGRPGPLPPALRNRCALVSTPLRTDHAPSSSRPAADAAPGAGVLRIVPRPPRQPARLVAPASGRGLTACRRPR